MELLQISKKAFFDFVGSLIQEKRADIIGPSPKAGRFSYEKLDTLADLTLDYDETTESPRKFLMPSRDTLLSYAVRDPRSHQPVFDERERVIIGIHPGDLTAIALYDKAFCADQEDSHYRARREHATLVGLFPTRPYKYRFTGSMIRESDPYLAADLMMVDMEDDTYAIEIVTARGRELIGRSRAGAASPETVAALAKRKTIVKDAVALPVPKEELGAHLAGQERHDTFKRRGDKCFSCGSCVTVCPTCVCFDVKDEVDLSITSGSRVRTWDGCTLENFATVAGGHNFRKTAAERVRHRLFRKTLYLRDRFGVTGCVGCGRCTHACTAGIASIAEMVGDIVGKGK